MSFAVFAKIPFTCRQVAALVSANVLLCLLAACEAAPTSVTQNAALAVDESAIASLLQALTPAQRSAAMAAWAPMPLSALAGFGQLPGVPLATTLTSIGASRASVDAADLDTFWRQNAAAMRSLQERYPTLGDLWRAVNLSPEQMPRTFSLRADLAAFVGQESAAHQDKVAMGLTGDRVAVATAEPCPRGNAVALTAGLDQAKLLTSGVIICAGAATMAAGAAIFHYGLKNSNSYGPQTPADLEAGPLDPTDTCKTTTAKVVGCTLMGLGFGTTTLGLRVAADTLIDAFPE